MRSGFDWSFNELVSELTTSGRIAAGYATVGRDRPEICIRGLTRCHGWWHGADAGMVPGSGDGYQPTDDRGVGRPQGESIISASGAPGYRVGPDRRPGLSMRSYGSTGRLARLDCIPRLATLP